MDLSVKISETFNFSKLKNSQTMIQIKKKSFINPDNKTIQHYNQKSDNLPSKNENAWNKRFIYYKIPNYDSTKDKNVIDPNQLKIPTSNCYYNAIRNNYNSTKKLRHSKIKKQYMKNKDKIYLNCSCKDLRHKKICSNNNKNNSMKIEKNNSPNLSRINTKIYLNNDKNKKNINAIPEKLIKIWNDLCILDPYRELFNIIVEQLDENGKNNFIEREINELLEFKNNLEKGLI